jgi:hypothetical protein
MPDATATLPGGDNAKFGSNPVDFEVDRTVGQNDQRHRLVASGVYSTAGVAAGLAPAARALAGGWWVSGILTAQSGQPYSGRINGDLNGDGNRINDLTPGTRRNELLLPSIVTLDLRIARDVPLAGRARAQIICEAFNLFNRDNLNAVVGVQYGLTGGLLTPNADFGRPLASAGDRIVQLAMKVAF